jgi:hypothetical protein
VRRHVVAGRSFSVQVLAVSKDYPRQMQPAAASLDPQAKAKPHAKFVQKEARIVEYSHHPAFDNHPDNQVLKAKHLHAQG